MIKVLLLLAVSIFAHEVGHIIAAKVFKTKIISIQFFLWPVFYIWFKETLIKIGWIPLIGYINTPGIYQLSKWKQIVFYLSGTLATALLMLINDDVLRTINLYMLIFNLLPFASSDGRKIFQVFFK